MAKSYTGKTKLTVNYSVETTAPLDDRIVVDTIGNLTDGSITAPYKGMVVCIAGTSDLYVLLTDGIENSKKTENWKKVTPIINSDNGEKDSYVSVNEKDGNWTINVQYGDFNDVSNKGIATTEDVSDNITKNLKLDSQKNADEKITVTANVGNLRAGDQIDYNSDIRSLLKQILSQETWATGSTVPTLSGTAYTIKATVNEKSNETINNNSSYEIGTKITGVSVLKPETDNCNGTIQTYKGQTIQSINAGCKWDGDYIISDKKDGGITSGSNTIVRFNRKYTASTASTTSNLGNTAGPNDAHGISISAGTTNTITISANGYYRLYWAIMKRDKASELTNMTKSTTETNMFDKDAKIKEYIDDADIKGKIFANSNSVVINNGTLSNDDDNYSYVFYCRNTYKPYYKELGVEANLSEALIENNKDISYRMPIGYSGNIIQYDLYILNNKSPKTEIKFIKK